MAAVKRDLIGELPKMRRAGRTDVHEIRMAISELTPVSERLYAVAYFRWWDAGVARLACRPGIVAGGLSRKIPGPQPGYGAALCGLLRSSRCVGFCVAFSSTTSLLRWKT